MLAWSLAARALSTADAACNARADAAATRASAPRSAAMASSSSCAVADRLACRPAMRSWDARARARPASAARSSAAAAFEPCSAARAAERAARAPAARSSPSSTMSVWPSRTRSPGDTRTSRTGARMRDVIVAVVRACTTPPESIALATSVIATWAMVTAMGSAASDGGGGGRASRASGQRGARQECRRDARNDDVISRGDLFHVHGLPIARWRVAVAVSTFTRAAVCWASACCTASAERSSMANSVRPLS